MSSYAQTADLYRYGAPASAFGTISGSDQQAALDDASARVDEFLAARYPLPLISWPSSITEYTCRIAAWNLISGRGYNPAVGNEGDQNLKARYDDAIAQLTMIQKQQRHPAVVAQPAQAPTYAQPTVTTSSVIDVGTGACGQSRGW
jgi:phage gp36-like protein